ncbi:MAG: Epimerase family protein [Chlamydiia bacterium]|nr:Epimerase family protein [Chlamydiia bacterium]
MEEDPRQLDFFSQTDVKNIAITGASGLVGSFLRTSFEKRGWHVISISRKILENSKDLKELLMSVDVVINLAGESIGQGRWGNFKKKLIYESRIKTTKKLVEVLNDPLLPPKVLISTSAVGYYGAEAKKVEDEDVKSGNDFLASVCKDWEKEALKYKKGRVVIPRFGAVMSKKGGLLAHFLSVAKFCMLGKIGDGKHMISWITIDDLADALFFCIKHKEIEGPVNFTAPQSISNKDLVGVILEKLHRPSFLRAPEFMIKFVFGDKGRELILSDQSVYPKKLVAAGYNYKYTHLKDFI